MTPWDRPFLYFLAFVALAEWQGGALRALGIALALTVGAEWCASPARRQQLRNALPFLVTAALGMAPWAFYGSLIALALLASRALGHWPQQMINDPKLIDGGPLYDRVWDVAGIAGWGVVVGMFGFPFALLRCYTWLIRRQRIALLWLGGSGVAGFFATLPLMMWMMD